MSNEWSAMPTYTVTAVIQGDSDPVTVVWSKDGNAFDTLTSIGQILNHDLRDRQLLTDWAVRTLTLTITIND
jgi:hypothetical protein